MNFLDNPTLVAWYNRNISAGWYKSTSFLANLFGIVVATLPDLVNWGLANTDILGAALMPAMDAQQKANFLLVVNVLAAVFRAVKQASVQKANIEQAAVTGKVIPLAASGVPSALASGVPVVDEESRIDTQPPVGRLAEAEAKAVQEELVRRRADGIL